MLYHLGEHNSLANQFLHELRDRHIQQDRTRFRRNMEMLGSIMAYEISKEMIYHPCVVNTPLGEKTIPVLHYQPVLITVLRAGMPYFQGFLNFFNQADCGFIGAYRQENSADIAITLEYLASPSLEGREVILIDPMLATGHSFIKSLEALGKRGTPSHLHIAALVAAPEGIQYVQKHIKTSYSLWTFAVDEKLDEQFYIVPGLGDAGDLSFGEKI
ncbi:MAG: uracil phosphoribosyltransferase [Cyclobacteriaceae bacterium]|nr:uracil phosphoribosyltransferase [Cyclobacteriaceae bacterium]